ncbi:hypothetical protein J6590_048184 [Homalodisca vitripennis]|nr:hypothetical protein J6590_048184 [Homalodisca vitripennis]
MDCKTGGQWANRKCQVQACSNSVTGVGLLKKPHSKKIQRSPGHAIAPSRPIHLYLH